MSDRIKKMSINKDDYASNIIECKQSKNSAFELLRIIAMILIIMHHYAYEIVLPKVNLDFFIKANKVV